MKRDEITKLVDHYGLDAMLEALTPYVSERRRERIEAVLDARLASVQVAIENPYDPHNAAAVVRSTEALGGWTVHVIAAHERILRAKGTTTGTHHWLETRNHRTLADFEAHLGPARAAGGAGKGMILAGACVDATHMLEDLPVDRPLCLLFGNEHAGLSPEAKASCDLRFRIPIHGFAESYNLSVSAALTLYSVTTRRRAAIGRAGDLEPGALAIERVRFYLQSIDRRHAKALFPPVE